MRLNRASSHFIVEKNGDLYSLVDELQIANHIEGTSLTTQNLQSIGIEIVNTGATADGYITQQYTTLTKLLKYLTQKYSIRDDDKHIRAHYEVVIELDGITEEKKKIIDESLK